MLTKSKILSNTRTLNQYGPSNRKKKCKIKLSQFYVKDPNEYFKYSKKNKKKNPSPSRFFDS